MWQNVEAKVTAEDLLKQGKTIKEIMVVLADQCSDQDVYYLKRVMKKNGKLPGVAPSSEEMPRQKRIETTINDFTKRNAKKRSGDAGVAGAVGEGAGIAEGHDGCHRYGAGAVRCSYPSAENVGEVLNGRDEL